MILPSEGTLDVILASLAEDKAVAPLTLDLKGRSSLADAMVIATGTSQRHLTAMAEHIRERLKAVGGPEVALEGRHGSDWIVIDAGDVIVHLFKAELRAFYELEKLWGAAVSEPHRTPVELKVMATA